MTLWLLFRIETECCHLLSRKATKTKISWYPDSISYFFIKKLNFDMTLCNYQQKKYYFQIRNGNDIVNSFLYHMTIFLSKTRISETIYTFISEYIYVYIKYPVNKRNLHHLTSWKAPEVYMIMISHLCKIQNFRS